MADNKDKDKKTEAPKAPTKVATPPPFILKARALIAAAAKGVSDTVKSDYIQTPMTKAKDFGLLGWMKVFTCVMVGVLTFVVYKTAPHWKNLWQIPYESTIESVADHKYTYSSKTIRYSNDLLAPQYFVLINKIVVNVKPGKLSTANPMIAFDLYIRTDTDAAAVEIKEREKQIQDHLQRFCENLPYDELQTEDGKQTWKNRMKRELNLVLNTGRVKEVFFKTLLIKP